jgi:hypothetical protein
LWRLLLRNIDLSLVFLISNSNGFKGADSRVDLLGKRKPLQRDMRRTEDGKLPWETEIEID